MTSWLPETCSAGRRTAGRGDAAGAAVVGWAGSLVAGGGLVTEPVQVVPLSANDAGTGLAPLHAPLKPIEVDAPVPSDPFQLRLAA